MSPRIRALPQVQLTPVSGLDRYRYGSLGVAKVPLRGQNALVRYIYAAVSRPWGPPLPFSSEREKRGMHRNRQI